MEYILDATHLDGNNVPASHSVGGRAQSPEGSIFQGPTSSPLRGINIGQLLDEKNIEFGSRTAVTSRWQQRHLTYQQLRLKCLEIGRSLLIHGVRPRDRVIVLAGNAVEFVQLYFAVGGIGAIFSIINPALTVDEVAAVVDFLGRIRWHPMGYLWLSVYSPLILSRAESNIHCREGSISKQSKTYQRARKEDISSIDFGPATLRREDI